MDIKRDPDNRRNNQMYYNQISRQRGADVRKKAAEAPRNASFGSQKVEVGHYVTAPEGYEGIFYMSYFILIPYFVGGVFLFFFVADGVYAHFKLLDLSLSSFLVLWIIGYEILATLILSAIFISFLRYDKKSV